MKKRQLRRNIRLGSIIILCIVISAITTILLLKEYKYPGYVVKKVPVSSYESQGKVNYSVFLLPNSLYDQKSLGEDQTYLSSLVDYIDPTYTYSFTGERPAAITGTYEIQAVLEGYLGDKDKISTLWQKQLTLLPPTSFSVKDKKLNITQKMPLKLVDFNNLIQRISDETKIKPLSKITVSMNVVLSAKTDQGVLQKKSTTSLEFPLSGNYFTITKDQAQSKPEVIEETQKVLKPQNKILLVSLGLLTAAALIGLGILLFGTEGMVIEKYAYTKELKKIFKKHGTRLAALDSELTAAGEQQSIVHSIEDLVKISDELGKPIVYKYNDLDEISRFWVIDDNRFYVYVLSEYNSQKELINS